MDREFLFWNLFAPLSGEQRGHSPCSFQRVSVFNWCFTRFNFLSKLSQNAGNVKKITQNAENSSNSLNLSLFKIKIIKCRSVAKIGQLKCLQCSVGTSNGNWIVNIFVNFYLLLCQVKKAHFMFQNYFNSNLSFSGFDFVKMPFIDLCSMFSCKKPNFSWPYPVLFQHFR